jgi:hypothetical protein
MSKGRATISDTSVAATDLNALNLKTSGTINATTVAAITGTAADVITTYTTAGFSGLGNETVTLNGSTSVADANSVDGYTTNVVTATISQGDLATLATLVSAIAEQVGELLNEFLATLGVTRVDDADVLVDDRREVGNDGLVGVRLTNRRAHVDRQVRPSVNERERAVERRRVGEQVLGDRRREPRNDTASEPTGEHALDALVFEHVVERVQTRLTRPRRDARAGARRVEDVSEFVTGQSTDGQHALGRVEVASNQVLAERD